jgi:phage gp29-like protein
MLLPQQAGADGQSFDADLLEAKDTTWKAFPGLIDVCERDILLAIRGTNLTSEVDGGSFAASQTHADEDSDYAESDRRKLASALVAQLFKPYVAFNFGDARLTPKFSYVAPPTNQKDQATTLKDLSAAVVALEARGWPIDRQVMSKNFGIPLLADVDPQQVPENPPANDVLPEAS